MANDYVIPSDELQETILYDIIQYLPLDDISINKNDSVSKIIKKAEEAGNLDESAKKAISENLPTIKKILEDRPELGEARISNMSWQDNNNDGKADYPVEGIQVCTFERAGKGYISFRGTPEASWIDNAEAYGKDSSIAKFSYLNLKIEDYNAPLANPSNATPADDYEDDLKILKNNTTLANPSNETENITYFELPRVYEEVIYKYTSPMQELAISYVQGLKKPTNGEMSIFDRCDEVVAIGHSKGGNELATLIIDDADYFIKICKSIKTDMEKIIPTALDYRISIILTTAPGKLKDFDELTRTFKNPASGIVLGSPEEQSFLRVPIIRNYKPLVGVGFIVKMSEVKKIHIPLR